MVKIRNEFFLSRAAFKVSLDNHQALEHVNVLEHGIFHTGCYYIKLLEHVPTHIDTDSIHTDTLHLQET